MRAAIYFSPPADAPLTRAAADWLGRDAFGGDASPAPEPALTESARRYGFHATLKAPFRLAEGKSVEELEASLAALAAKTQSVVLPALALARLDGFFALVPAARSDALDALAARIVETFEPFRAPLTPDEIARRRPETLSPAERAHLLCWGYPHVMEFFQFHMTLTDRVPAEKADAMEAALRARFETFLAKPFAVDHLAIFTERARGAPFMVHTIHPLKAAA